MTTRDGIGVHRLLRAPGNCCAGGRVANAAARGIGSTRTDDGIEGDDLDAGPFLGFDDLRPR